MLFRNNQYESKACESLTQANKPSQHEEVIVTKPVSVSVTMPERYQPLLNRAH